MFALHRASASVTFFLPPEGVDSTVTVTMKLESDHYTLLDISGDVDEIVAAAGPSVSVRRFRRSGVKISVMHCLDTLTSPGYSDSRCVPRFPVPQPR